MSHSVNFWAGKTRRPFTFWSSSARFTDAFVIVRWGLACKQERKLKMSNQAGKSEFRRIHNRLNGSGLCAIIFCQTYEKFFCLTRIWWPETLLGDIKNEVAPAQRKLQSAGRNRCHKQSKNAALLKREFFCWKYHCHEIKGLRFILIIKMFVSHCLAWTERAGNAFLSGGAPTGSTPNQHGALKNPDPNWICIKQLNGSRFVFRLRIF